MKSPGCWWFQDHGTSSKKSWRSRVNPRDRLCAAENRTERRSYPWLSISHDAKVQMPEKELQSSVSLTLVFLYYTSLLEWDYLFCASICWKYINWMKNILLCRISPLRVLCWPPEKTSDFWTCWSSSKFGGSYWQTKYVLHYDMTVDVWGLGIKSMALKWYTRVSSWPGKTCDGWFLLSKWLDLEWLRGHTSGNVCKVLSKGIK